MAATKLSSSYAEAMDIRAMIKDTIRKGKDIDRTIDGSNTLLHLAVQKDLVDCVVKLMSSGADANIVNQDGATARDLAIDNGNQVLLQVLSRREEYTMHLRLFNRCTDVSSSGSGMDHFLVLSSLDPDSCTTDAKMVPLCIGAVYEDYIDWSDSQRCAHLQKLVDNLRNEEFDLKRGIESLNARRLRNNTKLQDLHHSLRDREHMLCLEVWSAIQAERQSRRGLERASSEVVRVKELLSRALEYVHYRGTVRVAPYKRVFFNSWHYSVVVITGSMLIVDSPKEDCNAKNFLGKSFSMNFAQKSKDKSGSKTSEDMAAMEDESEGVDGDTDGSASGTHYATEAMLAAHALGKDGLPASSQASRNTSSYGAGDAQSSGRTKSGSRSKPFISYSTGPVRRKLQKLHDCNIYKRSINVHDVLAVEICKEDRSLGASYVQIELRIHFLKEGSSRQSSQNLLFSPAPTQTSDGVDGTRERLMSSSSNCSGNGSVAGSVRTSSTSSTSGAAANTQLTFATAASTPVKVPSGKNKQRSLSTGGKSSATASTSIFDPLNHMGGAPADAATTTSGSASSGAIQQISLSSDKVDTIWFKLPLQSNTTTRGAASGKKKRSSNADDGSGGPTLTFELFIAILKKVKENVRVYTVVHGVETPYKVNNLASDVSAGSSTKSTGAASAASKTSKTAVTGSPHPYSSPNSSFRKKNMSSGNLLESSGSSLGAAEVPPRHPVLNSLSSSKIPVPEIRTTSVGSNSSSCRTDSSSLSPKRNSNSATFSSRLSSSTSHSSSYQGGSMNSASGLTSIESLVGITQSRSSRTSMSASLSASGSMSSSSSGSFASALSMKGTSPRYEHKFMVDGALPEETTADLEGMDEEENSGFSRQQSLQVTDDEDTLAAEEPRRFLKLTRRYTEGDDALDSHPHVPSAMVYAKPGAEQGSMEGDAAKRGVSFCSLGLDEGAEDSAEDDEEEVSTRHTITLASGTDLSVFSLMDMSVDDDGEVEASQSSTRRPYPVSPHRKSISGDKCPSTPPATSALTSALTLDGKQSSSTPTEVEPRCFTEPPPQLKRVTSKGSVKATAETREQRRSADLAPSSPRSSRMGNQTGSIDGAGEMQPFLRKFLEESPSKTNSFLAQKLGGNAGSLVRKSASAAASEEAIQYPVRLVRMLERARSKRSKIEMRLVELLTSREKKRECIQYLQSLRAIVDNPPVTPTRTLAKTKAPSIDKAMLLLTVYGDHINQITEGLPSSSALKMMTSSAPTDQVRGNLNDAEEFVRVMLHVNNVPALSTTTVTSYGHNEIPGFNYNGDHAPRESFTSGRGSISAQRVAHAAGPSPLVRRLFAEESTSRANSVLRQSFAASPSFVSDPTPQLLRSPPPGYKADFDAVMSHLEEIWNCELESFQTVERLAQCLAQRGQTWQRLKVLREQEQSMAPPTKEDLYDVDF